jgi:thiol-disulfide isomerase/thioredoxin
MRLVSRFVKTMLLSAGLAFILSSGQNLWADDAKPEAAKAETAKPEAVKNEAASEKPAHQVMACYFHRTNRCPTCKKIGGYVEESVKEIFKDEIKQGKVSVVMIDFQDSKNKEQVDAYKIAGPTLILLDVRDGKVKDWKRAPKVWSLVSKKDDFFKYVQEEMNGYLESK